MTESRPEPDNTIIERFIRHGNEEDFRTLVERHVPAIRGLLYSILKGRTEDMEDAEQEILFALYRNLAKFRFESSFRSFLFRFARNKAIDLLRGNRREKKKAEAVKSAFSPEPETDTTEGLIANERIGQLTKALGRLDEQERSLVIMKEQGGCSIEELARVFGIPEGTVKSRLYNIRKKLFLAMKEESK
jgi:RNA polymerase sigma-70 factor (ECF subfamily)